MIEPLPKFFSILSIAAFRADSLSNPPVAASFFSFAMYVFAYCKCVGLCLL